MDFWTMPRWSPYIVGAGIGVLSWLSFLLSNKPLGCSTAFAKTSGMIERIFRGAVVEEREYYRKISLKIDWQWMLVIGVIIGAFVSALVSGSFGLEWVPGRFETAFGYAPVLRWVIAVIGGLLMGFGSRWADGCTSGHGISGTLQMAVSSWIAAIAFFIGGIVVSMLIFRVIAG